MRRGREPASRVSPRAAGLHVSRLLAAGWTTSSIARAAGVTRATVLRVRRRRSMVTRVVEQRILALAVNEPAETTNTAQLVESIDLLVAGGQRLGEIAERAGVSLRTLQRARAGQRIRPALALRVVRSALAS
jgi:DNA-binding CsgD family transcriptional regulator